MDDLYSPEKRERYYKQAHHIKQLMRRLQTADEIRDVYYLYHEIRSAVVELSDIKIDDLEQYQSHIIKMLNDINERGN